MRRTPLFFLTLTPVCITTVLLALLLTSFLQVQTSRAARPTYLTIGKQARLMMHQHSILLILYALKATNGSVIWSYATGGQVVSSPTVIDGMVYCGSNDGKVYALWLNDAAALWSYSTNGAVGSSPAVVLGSY